MLLVQLSRGEVVRHDFALLLPRIVQRGHEDIAFDSELVDQLHLWPVRVYGTLCAQQIMYRLPIAQHDCVA